MANRLLSAVSRHLRAPPLSVSVLKHQQNQILRSLSLILQQCCTLNLDCTPAGYQWYNPIQNGGARYCSSRPTDSSNEEEEDGEDEGEEEEEDEDDDVHAPVSKCEVQRGKSEEEKVEEAAEIGYKVIGPLDSSEYPFKPYEPFFAVVQIGSHQFKVSNGDSIFTERLKYCEVNNKLILNRVLMLGSKTQTIIGRPILPEAAVHAVVEEHALDAKVIIFKKKRRKNYRRTKGHRQELTKLRITDIQGTDKSENFASPT